MTPPGPEFVLSSSYKYLSGEMTPECWAWEFLRRNKSYRSEYADMCKLENALRQSHGENWAGHEDWLVFDPPKMPGETTNAWRLRTGEEHRPPRHWKRRDFFADRWRLKIPLDPDKSCLEIEPSFKKLERPVALVRLDSAEGFYEVPDFSDPENEPPAMVASPFFILAFDLSRSIKRQLEVAKKVLQDAEKKVEGKPTKLYGEKFTKYLIALDAKAAGANLVQINNLCNLTKDEEHKSSRALEFLKQAERMTQRYEAILDRG